MFGSMKTMAYNPKSAQNLVHFTKENQPANRGRKPSKLRKYIKENAIDAEDVSLMIKNVIMSKNFSELQKVLEDTKTPMLIRLFIKAFLSDFRSGTLKNTDTLLDRAIGKPLTKHEVGGIGGGPLINIDLSNMTEEEAKDAFFGAMREIEG